MGKVENGRDPDGKALYTGSYIASDFAVLVLSEAVLSEAVLSEAVISEAVLVLVIEYTESSTSTSTISLSTSTIKANIATSSPLAAA
jgi:hypothetical protein